MTLRISPDARWRTIDGEVVLVSQRAGEVMGLNDAGSRVIELVAAGTPWAEVLSTLEAEFDADPATIAADAHALATELLSLGVLEGSLDAVDTAGAGGSP